MVDISNDARKFERTVESNPLARQWSAQHQLCSRGGLTGCRPAPDPRAKDSHLGRSTSAQTVLPGDAPRSTTSHRSASASTRTRPRPCSSRGCGGGTSPGCGGWDSVRVSLTSMRMLPVGSDNRSSKSRPATRPWVTALAGQLGDDHRDRLGGVTVVRDAPGVQLIQGEVPGEAGAARGGAEALSEHTYGNGRLRGERCWHGPNLAGLRASSPGERRVRCASVRGYVLDGTCDQP